MSKARRKKDDAISEREPTWQEKAQGRRKRIKDQASGGESVDPTMHTHWARDKGSRVQELKNIGYRIAKPEEIRPDHAGWQDGEVIRQKDLVLMIAPRDKIETIVREKRQRSAEVDKAVRGQLDQQGALETIRDQSWVERLEHDEGEGTTSTKKYFIP